MRNPAEWTEEDLGALIRDQVMESLTLDYKASPSLQRTEGRKSELSKDVSAFANAAGGLLVYGVEEDGHLPIGLDGGFDPRDISKEWIEQVINSRISRRIDGIVIREVPLSGPRAGRVAYVVEVPSSNRAPHMASDHRFYKRFNFESVPMEEYEVRDVSRRLVAPDVRFGLTVLNDPGVEGGPRLAMLGSFVENHSPAAAAFALITFHLTARNFPTVGGVEKSAEAVVVSAAGALPVHSFKLEWRGSTRLPLMQGARYHVAQLNLSIADMVGPAHVFWEVLTPGSEPSKGSYSVERVGDEVSISPVSDAWNLQAPIRWQV